MMRIMRAEDERRWDPTLSMLLNAAYPIVRKRAALALGRIGDERALPDLIESLKADRDIDVRQMCAFAIGEIESPAGAEALIAVLDNRREPGELRSRAVEALGKIGAVTLSLAPTSGAETAASKVEDKALTKIRIAILDALKFEAGRRSMPDRSTILLGLTAALRVRLDEAGQVIVKFLGYSDPRVVADTLNAMARLRVKDRNDQVRQLLSHSDAMVRANAARVIGAAEDKGAFDALLDRALNDDDVRVRVSAIRALGSLKDARAAAPLLERGSKMISEFRAETQRKIATPTSQNELIEIAAALARVTPPLNDLAHLPSEKATVIFFINARQLVNDSAPEVEIGFARTAPADYLTMHLHNPRLKADENAVTRARRLSSLAQGLGEIAKLKAEKDPSRVNELRSMAQVSLASWLCVLPESRTQDCLESSWLRQPETYRAYAAFKPKNLADVLRPQLHAKDVIVRATAAELMDDQPPDETSTRALIDALRIELPRTQKGELNDAALAMLNALAKQKSATANDAIKTVLDSQDHLIRRRAVALLKTNGVGDFSSRIGTVKTRNTQADYLRAISRTNGKVTATVVTSKGSFTIEFLPEAAPLTVDNFIQLARKGYFNGQTIPRVVPNFVVQAGDPRGDQNGGPGYQIRCEVNEVPYERGALGMALSGKDTGGSQWFVTHSPQPHLDGGYTVFGRVIRGMDIVDNIARGDTIRRVIVNEK
jgi:cyclophilin family peptidyl-prolyl cis-trans isomerase/HEAT repeat protein